MSKLCAPAEFSLPVAEGSTPNRSSYRARLAERKRQRDWERENVRRLRRPSSDTSLQSSSQQQQASDTQADSGRSEELAVLQPSLYTLAFCCAYWLAGYRVYTMRPDLLLWWAVIGFLITHFIRHDYIVAGLFLTAGGLLCWHYL